MKSCRAATLDPARRLARRAAWFAAALLAAGGAQAQRSDFPYLTSGDAPPPPHLRAQPAPAAEPEGDAPPAEPPQRSAAAAAAAPLGGGLRLAQAPLPGVADDADDLAAATAPADAPRLRWLLGFGLGFAPSYAGAGRNKVSPSLLWGLEFGRVRIASSRSSALLGFGIVDSRGPGATARLDDGSGPLSYGVGLRVDTGRKSADAAETSGLPDIGRTVRGRAYVGWRLGEGQALAASVAQDLLGRGGGLTGVVDYGIARRFGQRSEWNAQIGLGFGNATYMRSYYGLTPAQAAASGRSAYQPGGSVRDWHAGVGVTTQLGPHWVGSAGLAFAYLLGPAAASPLAARRGTVGLSLSLGWRSDDGRPLRK
jgi:outer membrane scaffolding protein for murein synthesis (MipA/OmpV family)